MKSEQVRPLSMTRRLFTASAGAAIFTLAATDVARSEETIKLGFIGPLSGGNAQQGLGARNGFLLAIEQANASGFPYKIEGVVMDDAADPQTGVAAALKLLNDSALVGAIGHWNSSVALATTPIFQRYSTPFIIWGAISPKITEQNLPVVTRVTPTLVNENAPLAAWLANDMGVKKIAIVSDTTDYGQANIQWFGKFFTETGGEVIATDAVPAGTTDYRAILTRIVGLSPDALYFGGVIAEAGILRKQMVELGLTIPMVGISGFYDPEFITIAGDAANGTMVSYPKSASNKKLDKMMADYEARKFSEQTSPYTKYAYDAVNIMLEAIKAHGFQDKSVLAKAIREINYDGVLGTTTFDEQGQTKMSVEIEKTEVKDGQWVRR